MAAAASGADETGTAAVKAGLAASVLEVRVTGIESNRGMLAIALFDSPADYSTQQNAVRKAWLEIDSDVAVWTVRDLPAGDYAVIVYHDENDNKQIDMRALGMPKEPVGVSNNARGLFGPPRFKAASFELSPPLTRHEIALR